MGDTASALAAPDRVRVGCDVLAVDDVSGAVVDHGARYLDRVFTSQEQAQCLSRGAAAHEALAARFAAKEAVMKLLGRPDEVDLLEIEIVSGPSGAPGVRLRGRAAQVAGGLGLDADSVAVSLSHDRGVAFAVAVAPRPHHPDLLDRALPGGRVSDEERPDDHAIPD